MKKGTVYIVGAGPGDPDLITVRGLRAIERADLLVYDRLVNVALLDAAPSHAERIYAGKTPYGESTDQTYINELLVRSAQQGKTVVRLKGGDPFVFGRGGEEMLHLAAAGIPFEIIPGLSSAIAVPALVGVPVTHRHVATSFTVITGHGAKGEGEGFEEWARLPLSGTLIILMGVKRLSEIVAALLNSGRSADTSVLIIENGTLPTQKTVFGPLASIVDLAHQQKIGHPAIIVVGKTTQFFKRDE